MNNKENNNNILYGVIAFLILIIVAGASYFIGQNGTVSNTDTVNTKTIADTPMVIEAGNIGLDKDELKECIAENKYVDTINKQMKVGSDNFGITGTPGSVLINNETGEYTVISGAYPKEAFIENIDNLLSEEVSVKDEVQKSDKTFENNTNEDTLILISDKRDINTPIDQILSGLKQIETINLMTTVEYDFSDNGVEEYLKENNINTLPAIIFAKKDIDEGINEFLVNLDETSYSLNIGATFNPFAKLSAKGLKIINTDVLNQIKNSSYIDGNKDAKITWLEYSDLECPYCAKLHNSDVESTLKAKYGDELNIIFNHFPLGFHKKAIPGANILECVGEQGGDEAFYKILKYAFTNEIQE